MKALRGRALTALLGALVLFSAGCIRSYVDPALPKVSYSELQLRRQREPLRLSFHFQTLGVPNLLLTERQRGPVQNIFYGSGLFSEIIPFESEAPPSDGLIIIINNTASVSSALGNISNTAIGVVTLGRAASMITDHYHLIAIFTSADGDAIPLTYSHALHSTAGQPVGLGDVKPLAPEIAFERLLENLLLKLVYDLQQEGHLL